jgi:hypothetical protein
MRVGSTAAALGRNALLAMTDADDRKDVESDCAWRKRPVTVGSTAAAALGAGGRA